MLSLQITVVLAATVEVQSIGKDSCENPHSSRVASFCVHFNLQKRNSSFSLNCHIQIFIVKCLVLCGCHWFKMILYSDIAVCELLYCAIHFLASWLEDSFNLLWVQQRISWVGSTSAAAAEKFGWGLSSSACSQTPRLCEFVPGSLAGSRDGAAS